MYAKVCKYNHVIYKYIYPKHVLLLILVSVLLTSFCRRTSIWCRNWQLSWVKSQDPVGGHVVLVVSWLTIAKCKP